jgi:protein involved in polysaccharide export with SLBB domain
MLCTRKISCLYYAPLILIVIGCAALRSPSHRSTSSNVNNQDSTSGQSRPLTHLIESGDMLEISVYENPDLLTQVRVPEDGYIPFPLLGNLKIAGMTVLQLDSIITNELEERYIYNPLVTVVIKEYKQRNVYVTGEVKKPGGYPFETGLTVRKAISLAGGFTDKAAKTKIAVTRVIDNREVSLPVNLDDQIQEEDIITVPRSFF